jgi:hypothetical protein
VFLTSAVFERKGFNFEWDYTRVVKGFYNEPQNSLEVIFFGTSQVKTSISPAVLWTEYGITSYNLAQPGQPVWISYYYMKEALKYQKPAVLVLDVGPCWKNSETDATEHTSIDALRFSGNKIEAIWNTIQPEKRLEYYIDFLKYHENWKFLKKANFMLKGKIDNPYKGFTPETHYKKYPSIIDEKLFTTDDIYELPERSKKWLYKIIELCRESNVPLLLVKIPDSNIEKQPYYNAVTQIAQSEGIPFINFNTIMSGEAHMNIWNAEKFTRLLGEHLIQYYPSLIDKWNSDSEYFYTLKERYYLRNLYDIHEYLNMLDQPNYLVLISAKDEASAKFDDFAENYQNLGFSGILRGKFRYSYIGVLDSREVLYEKVADDELSALEYSFSLNELEIKIVSRGYYVKNTTPLSSITINGKEYSQNRIGLNIVVYDKTDKRIVDSVNFDTFWDLRGYREKKF